MNPVAIPANNPFGPQPFGSIATPFGGQTGSSVFGSQIVTGFFHGTKPLTFGTFTSAFGTFSSTHCIQKWQCFPVRCKFCDTCDQAFVVVMS
jgi:hypothetical protein